MGLRESILAVDDSHSEVVEVPEWKCSVRVRSLNEEEMERWWDILNDHAEKGVDPPGGRKAALLVMGCIDEKGESVFKAEDQVALGKKHPEAINRLFSAIQRLSAMTEEERLAIEKKLKETTSSSPTGSQTDGESTT